MGAKPQDEVGAGSDRLTADVGRLARPAILVHGGAGTFARIRSTGDAEGLLAGLSMALDAGWKVLEGGGSAIDAVVEAVAALEDSGRFNAGRGAVTTAAGDHEFDASVMDGTTGGVGAICAATWPANPVRVAKAVADVGGAPDGPLLLAGWGADRFAKEQGFPEMTPAMLQTARGEGGAAHSNVWSTEGTVGAVAVDAQGRVAAATSTGGREGQLPGRVGDSPIPGAGVWAAEGTAAVSATGAGEAFVVAGFSHRIDWHMRAGHDLATATAAALQAVADLGGDGGAIAVAPDGSYAASFNSPAMARGWRDKDGEVTRIYPKT